MAALSVCAVPWRTKTMTEKPSGGWAWDLFKALAGALLVAAFFAVVFYANTQSDNRQSKSDITDLKIFDQAQQATNTDFSNRLVRLENERADDVANVSTQLQSMGQTLRDLSASVAGMSQAVASGQAQTQILLGQLGLSRAGVPSK
jgi:hypothetical protein